MSYSVIIPAAGKGERLHLGYNKVLHRKHGTTVIERTVAVFLNDRECQQILLVIPPDEEEIFRSLFDAKQVQLVYGGATRSLSVWNAVPLVTQEKVLVHDGARCLLSKALLKRVTQKLEEGFVNVIPTVCSKDAILVDGKYPPHSVRPKLVQTPQGFRTADLIKAMEQAYVDQTLSSFKDDSSIVAHYLGFTPEEVEGDYENIKITTKDDLRWLG